MDRFRHPRRDRERVTTMISKMMTIQASVPRLAMLTVRKGCLHVQSGSMIKSDTRNRTFMRDTVDVVRAPTLSIYLDSSSVSIESTSAQRRCSRCFESFGSRALLDRHSRDPQPCGVIDCTVNEKMTKDQKNDIRNVADQRKISRKFGSSFTRHSFPMLTSLLHPMWRLPRLKLSNISRVGLQMSKPVLPCVTILQLESLADSPILLIRSSWT
jgi:hypothetical protein